MNIVISGTRTHFRDVRKLMGSGDRKLGRYQTRVYRMGYELGFIFLKYFWLHVQTEVYPEQKVYLQTIQFADQNPAHLRIVCIVVVGIIEKLRR